MAQTVAERGYPATSVAAVAAAAGVSTKAFYEHFAGKEDCFLAAYDARVQRLLDGLAVAPMPASELPLVRFERMLARYLEGLAADPAGARTFLIEVYAAGPRALERRAAVQGRFVDFVADGFGVAAGDRGGRFACQALVGAVSSMVTARVGARDYASLRELRAPLVRLVAELHPRWSAGHSGGT